MKKISKIMLLLMAMMFLSIGSVKAENVSITCPKTATVGTPFTCNVTTDQTIYISTDLRVYKGSTTMEKNGSIEFKASEAKDYDIGIISEDGSNTFDTATITVKAATTTKTTTTTTTKAKSDNNYLSSISVNGEKIDNFSKNTAKYFVEVENDIKRATISGIAEDDLSSVEVDGPSTLSVGDNEFTISVTSESNTTKFYKVIVTRKDEEESSSTDIKKIKIKGYKLNFDNNSKTFHLNIDKEDTELDIIVTLKDKNADYEIEGNENLKDGSVIKINVTAEDGTTDTYRIIIEKKESNIFPLIIGLILLLIIVGIIIFAVIKKKKNKDNSKPVKEANTKSSKEKELKEEKTIEMPVLNKENDFENSSDDERIPVDNDEEEKTRMLSFAEEEELERTKLFSKDEETNDDEDELEKTLLFKYDIDDE